MLVVGSAPQYPQGVVDPIPELAALAAEVGASFHTDACMGGFLLPFVEELGHDVPPWDFRVDGVTTISADLHKLGYAPKGASVVLHRTKALRRYQTFVFDDWLGGFYASPGMQGTRSALPMATAWATLHHLGIEGYLRLTELTIDTRARMVDGIRAIDGLAVLGEPEAQCVAMATAPGYEDALDVFAVGDALLARGWFHDRQKPPDSLHSTVSAGNAPGDRGLPRRPGRVRHRGGRHPPHRPLHQLRHLGVTRGAGPSFDDVRAAAARIAPRVPPTPVLRSARRSTTLGRAPAVHLKAEHLHATGAFKLRGATNAVLLLSDEEAARGWWPHTLGQPRLGPGPRPRRRGASPARS